MRRILLASHGHLASGLKSSIDILAGESSGVTAIDAYVDDSDYTAAIREFIDSCAPDDEAIIFTDILGGSVFQKVALEQPEQHGVMHVTGMNLAAVMECLLTPEKLTQESVDEICAAAASQLRRVQVPNEEASDDSGEGFYS